MCLSWFGWIAAVKMKVLPKFIFVFGSLVFPLPVSVLNESVLQIYLGREKKLRINMLIRQQKNAHGGVALPMLDVIKWLYWKIWYSGRTQIIGSSGN